ncbi:MAG: aspartate kinase [Anaeroplasmataceae bacterium]
MSIVCKFGGSSMADAEQFEKVKNIVLAKNERKIVVVSAIGKKKSEDSKITDLLYLLHAHIKYKVNYNSIFDQIKERYYQVKNDLGLKTDLDNEFNIIESNFKSDLQVDYIVSRGEYLAAKLMADYIGCKFIDAKDVIKFNYDGTVNYDETGALIKEYTKGDDRCVIPGFYGSYDNGEIHLFSRGGSDITGSIVAKSIGASIYENWTDVCGILMADPRIIKNPHKISKITYEELRELSYMGASVLHQDAIFPIEDRNIPINILNTNDPLDSGTIISNNDFQSDRAITGIAGKKDFTSIMILKKRFARKIDVLSQIFNVFKKYSVNVELVPTGVDAFSFVVETAEFEKVQYKLLQALREIEDIVDINIENGISLVAIVGKNMASKPGFSGQIFAVLGQNGINVKIIAQGSHEYNIIVGVATEDFEKAIKVIYDNMVE